MTDGQQKTAALKTDSLIWKHYGNKERKMALRPAPLPENKFTAGENSRQEEIHKKH